MSTWKQRQRKGIKPKSKGMKKHIRRLKAKQRKEQALKEQIQRKKNNKQANRFAKFPSFYSFPMVKTSGSSWQKQQMCPHCMKDAWESQATEINTKEGKKLLRRCNGCRNYFRIQ